MTFREFFRQTFGSGGARVPESIRQPESPEPAETPSIAIQAPPIVEQDPAEQLDQELFEASYAARDRRWSSLGKLEDEVIGYLISPSLLGGPEWPTTRQAYAVIRRPSSVILATDGLSDPFEGGEPATNGFEMELFIETQDIPATAGGIPGDVSGLKSSWALALLQHVAELVADIGGIVDKIEKHGSVSAELPGLGDRESFAGEALARFMTEDKTVGVLLGAPLPAFDTLIKDAPLSPIQLVPVVLLTAAELELLRADDVSERRAFVARLAASPTGHLSDLSRQSLV